MATELSEDTLWQALRSVTFPGYSRDIVSFGFVRDVRADQGRVLVRWAPVTQDAEKIREMLSAIESALGSLPGVTDVEVDRELPLAPEQEQGGELTPLQAELIEDGGVPEPDALGPALRGTAEAPEAGYTEAGPDPLPGPEEAPRAQPAIPVLQWEIDPADPRMPGGEGHVIRDGWEYRLWWKRHGAEIVYVSIHGMREDADERPGVRAHPIGRAVAVNLVYDLRRSAVVAIYGLAQDFRPFVAAFAEAYGLATPEPDSAATEPQTARERR